MAIDFQYLQSHCFKNLKRLSWETFGEVTYIVTLNEYEREIHIIQFYIGRSVSIVCVKTKTRSVAVNLFCLRATVTLRFTDFCGRCCN
jgi:hypothetical protein